jgi:hypothetical protein
MGQSCVGNWVNPESGSTDHDRKVAAHRHAHAAQIWGVSAHPLMFLSRVAYFTIPLHLWLISFWREYCPIYDNSENLFLIVEIRREELIAPHNFIG